MDGMCESPCISCLDIAFKDRGMNKSDDEEIYHSSGMLKIQAPNVFRVSWSKHTSCP
jgi:hypothetical protein